jgi:hypothetical protein
MRLQRLVWFVDRFLIHVLLILLSVVIIFALTYEIWLLSLIGGVVFLFAIYKGLIRLKILRNSVVVCHGRVFFFVPETTVRDRFDFITRGQSVIQLPEYQLLDRPFKIELFYLGGEALVCSCRLSLRFAYLMQPAAWQRAYDSFVAHGERFPHEVKRLLLKSCDMLEFQSVAIPDEEAIQEYLDPIVSRLNQGLEGVGLEVIDVQCSFTEGVTLCRYLAGDQQDFEKKSTGTVFKWQIREVEGAQRPLGALMGVDGNVVR